MTTQLRQQGIEKLTASAGQARQRSAFLGLDGFVDEIIHVVDRRQNANAYSRLATISQFAKRLAEAAGQSTNIELVTQMTKIGGNGPIMANALATFGLKVTYLGNLGYPALHPVFNQFAENAEVYSIAEACHTDALEFLDGKLMLGKSTQLREVTWANIQARFGREKFASKFNAAHLVGFVNWTMVPFMTDIWESVYRELCSQLSGPRRLLFFDLADPQKRSLSDISSALQQIVQFERYFDVILGLNEKEAFEIAEVFGLKVPGRTQEALSDLARQLHQRLPIHTLAIHPVTYALAAHAKGVDLVSGPSIPKPVITTGAGDHFNAGFCLGKLLGFDNPLALLTGVASSGFYVATGQSPTVERLIELLRNWPGKQAP